MSVGQATDVNARALAATGPIALSPDEKARIRDEMFLREEVRREIAAAKPAQDKHGIHPFLNSPFFLTVVCGLAASIIGQIYVHANARNERALAQENSQREKKTILITSVANDLPTFVSIYGSMKRRQLWLLENKGDTAKDEYGRSREDVYKTFAEFFKMYVEARKPAAILAEVRSFFDSADVLVALEAERAALDRIDEAKTPDEVKVRAKEQEKTRDALLTAMAAELRRVGRRD